MLPTLSAAIMSLSVLQVAVVATCTTLTWIAVALIAKQFKTRYRRGSLSEFINDLPNRFRKKKQLEVAPST